MNDFLNTYDGLKISGKLMSLLSQEQATITSNITNVDTPQYVRKESNFENVIGSMRSPIETELAKKMGAGPLLNEQGGKVVLENELLNMQRNFLLYNMVTRRAGSLINIIKNAAQIGR